jgi:hypothetical protein
MLVHAMKLINFLGFILLILPAVSQALSVSVFATRSYCMPIEGRFELEPFPLGAPDGTLTKMELAERKNQGVYAASASQSSGTLIIPCNIFGYRYKAVIDYETRDSENKYLNNQCNRLETYTSSLSLYRNNQLILQIGFGGQCRYSSFNRLTVWQKDDSSYRIEACQQEPGWDNGDPTANVCNEVSRQRTDKALTDAEMAKLLRMNYQVIPISPTQAQP